MYHSILSVLNNTVRMSTILAPSFIESAERVLVHRRKGEDGKGGVWGNRCNHFIKDLLQENQTSVPLTFYTEY